MEEKTLKTVTCLDIFDSQKQRQESPQPQDLKKQTSNIQKLGLVKAQCKGIAACAYSSYNILTVQFMVCSIKTHLSFGQLDPE